MIEEAKADGLADLTWATTLLMTDGLKGRTERETTIMLKALLTSLDGLDDSIKAHYRPGTADEGLEGKFVLHVEAAEGLTLENVDGLKSALGAKKAEADAANTKLKAFEGLDPAAARDAIAKMAEFGNLDPASEADKIAQGKIEAIKTQMETLHIAEKQKLENRLASRDKLLQRVLVEDQAIRAITAEGGDVELLLPHVIPSVRLKLEELEDGTVAPKVTVVDAQGNPRIGDSSGKDLDVSGLVQGMKTHDRFSRLFESSGHQGSGSGNERKPGSKNSGQRPDGHPSTWSRAQKIDYVRENGQEAYNDLAATEKV